MKKDFFNKNLMVPNNIQDDKISELNDSGRQSNMVFKSIAYPSKIYYPHIQKFIKRYTKEEAVILDSFSGSGSTGVAAAIENRKHTNSLNDTNPLSAYITYRKPIEEIHRFNLDEDAFKFLDENFAVNNLSFRQIQDELINIVHNYNLSRLPSDKEIKEWIQKVKKDRKI